MEGSDGSPPQSLCMIRAAELFPKPQMEKEDTQLIVPFQELAGESVRYMGRTDDGVLALSNYRIFLLKNSTNSETSVPLGLIEAAQSRDLFHLIINCKDASTVKCSFETAEQCSEWQRRIQMSVGVPETLESLFAFPFCSWTCDSMANNGQATAGGAEVNGFGFTNPFINGEHLATLSSVEYSERLQRASRYEDDFMREVERLGYDLHVSWRISCANEDFKLCPSYPRKILVPSCVSDETLQVVANFRGSRRLPAVVWRHKRSGAVIARCSQPEVGWLGWRNSKDEQLLKALADACAFDRGEQMRKLSQSTSTYGIPLTSENGSSPSSPDCSHEEVALDKVRKVLIVDARSYTSAVTNRARGGGCECIEYYPCAEIEFMNLGNIHVIRKSFHALRQLCASPPDVQNWLGLLEKTMWLQHLSGLLAASVTVCHAIEKKGRPVLVHCSDGWDRTPQIVATAQLCLDPYYRTVEGFRILVEREWLNYGHKFADRCGHGPGSDEQNERCPVFLQWLDLVHQIHKKFPCSFEFSMGYLIKLAQHSHSCLFGTFLCNNLKERIENSVFERTFSVWPFLSGPMYRNPLYVANRETVLWPPHNVRDLSLWTEVYLGSLGNKNSVDFPPSNGEGLQGSMSPMAKTRSYGDLITAGIIQNGISRRSSDPNMAVDMNLTIGSNSENNSIADIQSEREDSPDLIANLIHDTTRKLQNLTTELNNHDEANYQQLGNNRSKPNEMTNGVSVENAAGANVDVDIDENSTSNSSTMQQLLQHQLHQQQQQQQQEKEQQIVSVLFEKLESNQIAPTTSSSSSSSLLYSSPSLPVQTIGCEINPTSAPLTSLPCAISSNATTSSASSASSSSSSSILPSNSKSIDETQNSFNGYLSALSDIARAHTEDKSSRLQQCRTAESIAIHATNDLNLNLMQSIDLGDPTTANKTVPAELTLNNDQQHSSEDNHSSQWHGSVSTSTDTLVPIEASDGKFHNGDRAKSDYDHVDGGVIDKNLCDSLAATTMLDSLSEDFTSYNSTHQNCSASIQLEQCNILPKVHSRPNMLETSSGKPSSASFLSSSASGFHEKLFTYNINNNNSNNNVPNHSKSSNKSCESDDDNIVEQQPTLDTSNYNPMEESILILPEHQKLEISLNGECESIANNATLATLKSSESSYIIDAARTTAAVDIPSSSTAPFGATAQRRRRTSSSNSRRDYLNAVGKPVNGSTTSKFSIPGVRSLPLTPPGLPDRSQIAISCPDGLAHALSEQNIRLQQIVHEHKLREDVLLREIHDMRMALLKKTCPNCNHSTAANDEQCSVLDNLENTSVCSWEAVEDRSGPSSCTSSSIQANASSVLWVPDHAVSRCTSCQTEFWLGRRKHHCRSCGQIFCADCSEFWAPLPDEKLFSPVRLCGPCYHSVTTRMQQQQQVQRYKRKTCSNIVNNTSNSCGGSSTGNVAATTATNALTLKTLSALALAQKPKLTFNAATARSSDFQALLATTKVDGRKKCKNIATSAAPLTTTKSINVVACCNHAASVATKCQQQQHPTTMKAATTAASN